MALDQGRRDWCRIADGYPLPQTPLLAGLQKYDSNYCYGWRERLWRIGGEFLRNVGNTSLEHKILECDSQGIYLCTADLTFAANATGQRWDHFHKTTDEGSPPVWFFHVASLGAGTNQRYSISCVVPLTTSDTLRLFAGQNSGVDLLCPADTTDVNRIDISIVLLSIY